MTLLLVFLFVCFFGLVINGGPCDCCNPYHYYYYYSYYGSGGGSILTPCCPNPLPAKLFGTVTVNGAWCGTSGIDGMVVELDWNGVDQYYGTIPTNCTNCDLFFVRLRCVTDTWLQDFGFISSGATGTACVTPAAPPIPACTGSITPFDCDTLTASRTEFFNGIDVLASPHCCDNIPPDLCESITVTITP